MIIQLYMYNLLIFYFQENCSESTPVIPNGNIVHRTYFPASITYGCDPNYISHGSNQTINCTVGWDWSPLDYRCSIGKQHILNYFYTV